MKIEKNQFKWTEIVPFLRSKLFLYTLIRIGILLIILWILHSFILNFYTNHGQRLKLAKYLGVSINNAIKHAEPRGYEIIITDSVHVIGRSGGIILSQLPKPGSYVKRGRKIYVSITRYKADEILSEALPILYGKKYEHKRIELENNFELKSKIIGFEYDPGPIGHIISVKYRGQTLVDDKHQESNVLISKGDTLEFILSQQKGGEVELPNLRCKTMDEVKFLLIASNLELGNISKMLETLNPNEGIVVNQFPEYQIGKMIKMKEAINVTISDEFPIDCDEQ
jgi:beta-lactam-binding protein with PASTA domain